MSDLRRCSTEPDNADLYAVLCKDSNSTNTRSLHSAALIKQDAACSELSSQAARLCKPPACQHTALVTLGDVMLIDNACICVLVKRIELPLFNKVQQGGTAWHGMKRSHRGGLGAGVSMDCVSVRRPDDPHLELAVPHLHCGADRAQSLRHVRHLSSQGRPRRVRQPGSDGVPPPCPSGKAATHCMLRGVVRAANFSRGWTVRQWWVIDIGPGVQEVLISCM